MILKLSEFFLFCSFKVKLPNNLIVSYFFLSKVEQILILRVSHGYNRTVNYMTIVHSTKERNHNEIFVISASSANHSSYCTQIDNSSDGVFGHEPSSWGQWFGSITKDGLFFSLTICDVLSTFTYKPFFA